MSAWADKLKRRAAELQQQPLPLAPAEAQTPVPEAASAAEPDAGWTRGPDCWIRAGLSAEDRRAALRRVIFFEPGSRLDILICKPQGEQP